MTERHAIAKFLAVANKSWKGKKFVAWNTNDQWNIRYHQRTVGKVYPNAKGGITVEVYEKNPKD